MRSIKEQTELDDAAEECFDEEDEYSEEQEQKQLKVNVLSSVLLAIAVLFCMVIGVQIATRGYVRIMGYSLFRVVTGSMEPAIPTGAVLICKETDISEIAIEDIVCYKSRVSEIYNSVVTHRVVEKYIDNLGRVKLETRGDANVVSDSYLVSEDDLVGKVIWYTGKENLLTAILTFISGKIGFLACIVFPVLLVAGLLLQRTVNNLRKSVYMAEYELERGPLEDLPEEIPEEDRLEGYTTLTKQDEEELYERLKKEMLEEIGKGEQKDDSEEETEK